MATDPYIIFMKSNLIMAICSIAAIAIVFFIYKRSFVTKINIYANIILVLGFILGGLRPSGIIKDMAMNGIITFIGYVIIVVLVVLIIRTIIVSPLLKLKDAADKITSGEFDVKLPHLKSKDEIAGLTASLEMLIVAFKSKLEIIKNIQKKSKK